MIKKWNEIEKIYAAIIQALVAYNQNINVYAYNEMGNKCVLTKIYHHKKIYSILPVGNTPSWEACIEVYKLMDRRGRNIILNLSDGLCNVGIGYNYAMRYCDQRKIDLVTLGSGLNIKRLSTKYGRNRVIYFEDIEELPDVIQNIFRAKLLHRVA